MRKRVVSEAAVSFKPKALQLVAGGKRSATAGPFPRNSRSRKRLNFQSSMNETEISDRKLTQSSSVSASASREKCIPCGSADDFLCLVSGGGAALTAGYKL